MIPEGLKMSNSEKEDAKEKYKAALDKKNQFSKELSINGDSNGSSRIQASSGKTHKIFRRKSG
jgi:hypothetical protein